MAEQQADFINTQFNFTAHIRDPEHVPLPDGIEARRMKIYSDLFYNNIEGFISSSFPVLKTVYSEEDWHSMVRDFFIKHRCETPYFLEIAEEFLAYLQHTRTPQPQDPAFLIELAHYEWVELALMVADEEIDLKGINPNGDLLDAHPQVSSLAWSLAYQYPVHQISADFTPEQAASTASYLVVYRDRNDSVEFMEVNPVTARLLQLINEDQKISGRQALKQIADELQTSDTDSIIQAGHDALQQLQQHGIIVGSK